MEHDILARHCEDRTHTSCGCIDFLHRRRHERPFSSENRQREHDQDRRCSLRGRACDAHGPDSRRLHCKEKDRRRGRFAGVRCHVRPTLSLRETAVRAAVSILAFEAVQPSHGLNELRDSCLVHVGITGDGSRCNLHCDRPEAFISSYGSRRFARRHYRLSIW